MHLKDIEAAISDAVKSARKALTVLERVQDTLAEADQQVTLCVQLDQANELEAILASARDSGPKPGKGD